MPLLDHFHPPLSAQRHWQGFHSAWTNALTHQLNEVLPPRYFAEPNVQLGVQVEADVATFEEHSRRTAGDAAVATAVWAPSRPAISVPVEFGSPDLFEVRVMNDEEGPRLVAAIEVISPANRDRPASRTAFAIKCVSYLQQGISVIMLDVVTSRTGNLHAALVELLGSGPDGAWTPESGLYGIAYRTHSGNDGPRLDAWTEALRIGQELPVLPLWLDEVQVLPLDLERSYTTACRSLRIAG